MGEVPLARPEATMRITSWSRPRPPSRLAAPAASVWRRLAALLLCSLAGDAAAAPLTIDEAVARALAASPAARAARLEATAAEERTAQAHAKHLGDLDLVGSASRYEGPRLLRPLVGPISPAIISRLPFDQDQLHYGVTWQIPLFAGGALVEGDRAARLAEVSTRHATARSLDELRYNVRAAYRNALGLRHALGAAEAYEEALTRDESSSRLRVEAEAWARADGAKISFALESARARRAALSAQLRTSLGLLAALMGEDGSGPSYDLRDIPAEPAAPTATTEGMAAAAQAGRADLLAAREAAEAQRSRAGVVRAGFWPQLSFAGNLLVNKGSSIPSPIDTYELTILLKFPLFSDLGRYHALREAEAAAAAAEERRRAKELEVRTQVLDAAGRLEASRAGLAAGKAQRSLGAEVARVEKLRFEQGTGKVEDYLLARAQQLEGETGYWLALYGLQSAVDYADLVSGSGGHRE